MWKVHHGDCLDVMRGIADTSVHAIVTDPPYGLGFMGKAWDDLPPGVEWAEECLRVLRPGGYLLAFGGTRTFHRLAVAVEDAGFEIRDSIAWLYGSGFPKGKQQLKPAFEPIVVARKPLTGTVAANIQAWGTGALNVDACRVAGNVPTTTRGGNQFGVINDDGWQPSQTGDRIEPHAAGRWPANVVLDGDQADALDQQSGITKSGGRTWIAGDTDTTAWRALEGREGPVFRGDYARKGDSGGASRYFPTFRYQAKAPTAERPSYTTADGRKIAHPTVKPLSLMRWLVRLVTPPGGTVLDPFAGSGATVEACLIEGFDCIAIERDADYLPLIAQRIDRQAATLPFEDVG